MATFVEYVKSLPSALAKLGSSANVHVTVGNESCDLDSMVSALSHAHYLYVKNNPIDAEFISLPLFACKQADFDLRLEAVEVFNMVGISPDDLVFSDQLTTDKLLSVREVTLVDHNALGEALKDLTPKVVEVFDHHKVSDDSIVHRENVRSTVETVGSCATLVADKLLQDDAYPLGEGLVTLLLSAIVMDTSNLQSEGIVTDKDKSVVEELQKVLSTPIDLEAHFKKLFSSRFDISQLSTTQVLGCDFKLAKVCDKYLLGFSSVTAILSEFVQRDGFGQELSEFYHQNNLDALLLLGIFAPDGDMTKRQRQIVIYQPHSDRSTIPSPDFAESLANVLEASEDVRCERVESEGVEGILLNQGNVQLSRKQILPIVVQFVSDIEKEHSSVVGVTQHPLEPQVTVVTTKGEAPANRIAEYSIEEEADEVRTHRFVSVAGDEHVIDMNLVQPYRQIVQHAGYIGNERMAVMVFSACHLPSRSLPNYKQVAQEIFYYIMSVLDRIIVDQYMIVYLHSGAPHHSRPSLQLLRKFYQLVDHRFRKQLTNLYIVHPTFLVKTILSLARPFISTKFWRKVHFVQTLEDLSAHVAIDDDLIPTPVLDADKAIMARRPSQERYHASAEDTELTSQQK